MKVSVIVPAYKFFNYLEHALMSALWQITDFDFEVLVRDDFSQDGSDILLKRMAYHNPRLKNFESNENWGIYKNIKFLYEQAQGKYIAYLDGDDYFTDQYKLQKQVDFLDRNPDFSCHATGSLMLFDGHYAPDDYKLNLASLKETITPEDFFEHNHVSFGRMFRNYKNLFKDYMQNTIYLDYAINFELSLLGKIKCEEWLGGVYRTNGNGVFASISQEERERAANPLKKKIKEIYLMNKTKTITIIDSFVSNSKIENKLKEFLINFKSKNTSDIMLISNSVVNNEMLKHVQYHFYDCNNRLFEKEYTNLGQLNLFHIYESFEINDLDPEMQRHGLSVLVNLFNSLFLAKYLGYTHFQRFEVDDIISEKGFDFINQVPVMCLENQKKGLFYFNDGPKKDVSFHYYFCEIDYFLKMVKNIKSEDDYRNYIFQKRNNYDFMNVEEFLFKNIEENDVENLILQRPGELQKVDFDGTIWNTESSESNKPPKYEGCTSKIYRTNHDEYEFAIVTYNYTDKSKHRLIRCFYENGAIIELHHVNPSQNSWSFELVKKELKYIEVYEIEESTRFLYREENENINSTLLFKK